MAKTNVLDTIATEPQKKGKDSNIKTIPVRGDAVSRYAKASDELKTAKATMAELAPLLQSAGIQAVFEANIEAGGVPKDMISSVNLVDREKLEEPEGTVDRVQFSFVRKDLKNDPKQVSALFARLRTQEGKVVKLDDYCEWVVTGEFNEKVLLKDGKFDEERYKKFMKALDAVSAEFGVENPLSCTKKLVPKADFHDRRFADFDITTNTLLAAVLPTSVQLEATRAMPTEEPAVEEKPAKTVRRK